MPRAIIVPDEVYDRIAEKYKDHPRDLPEDILVSALYTGLLVTHAVNSLNYENKTFVTEISQNELESLASTQKLRQVSPGDE